MTTNTPMQKKAFRAAFPHTIPIFAGFWFLGLTYGIYMNVSGFSFWYPMLMSLTIFAGSVEFVTVNMLMGGFNPLQALAITLMINARHLFYDMTMTLSQQIITIAMVILGTALTRFLPFLLFPSGKPTPKYIQYLGKVLPSAVFGLLIIYCLKNVSLLTGSHGIPELISILLVIALHLWKRQMLVSIAGGTICYMLLVQFLF